MATVAAVPIQSRAELTPGQALRIAWLCWLVLLAIPALLFLAVMWTMLGTEGSRGNVAAGEQWFLACMGYLAVAVPAAFFWRSREFKAYWDGRPVSPGKYLRGMLIVWLTLEVGGIVALTGCLVTDSLTPTILPALVAFILFTPFWPSGRAMTHPVGNDDDFEIYEEPR